jgi:hypothetical protein
MAEIDILQIEIEWEVAAEKWRREVDLPRVRRIIQEHRQEMGREGQYLRLFALYDQLEEAKEDQFWRRKRYEASTAANRPYDERGMITWFIREAEPQIEKIRREIALLQVALFQPQHMRGHRISPGMIERAKEYPIENIVEAHRGMARCIFHEDQNPSMSIKNNFAHCFSCGKTADVIEVYQKLNGATFPEAVRAMQ